MTVLDLTQESGPLGPTVGMFARFPPSTSGSAAAACTLAEKLERLHGITVEVIRLVLPGEPVSGSYPVVMDLNPRWHMSAPLAAQRANRCDVALIQLDRHIPLDVMGEFLTELSVPVVLSVDDVGVVGSPEAIALAGLARRASVTVVPSEVARRRLAAQVGPETRIAVVSHGSPFQPLEPHPEPRAHILTWGFMAPGVGAHRVIRALPLLGDLDPLPRYRLVGVSDPGWTRQDAADYRADLTAEAERLDVASQVEVVPMLHSPERLASEIERSDLLVVPYDETDRSASRILSEALTTGRPVVATAFPGAIEMLSSGAGTTVAHDSAEDMADAIRRYLSDDSEYRRAARLAAALSPGFYWDETASRYATLIREVAERAELVEESST